MTVLKNIFTKLGLDKTNGLFITSEGSWEKSISFPSRVKRLLENRIKPDAFFCFDNKPLILFFDSPGDKEALKKEIWNFNECPVAIIIENNAIEIYNGFKYEKEKKTLELLGGEDKLNDFSYFQLVTGRTWEQYQEHFGYKNRIDYHLLDNIKAARNVLVEQQALSPKIANALIGKSVFVRYLIDRSVKMKFESNRPRIWTNDEFCDLLNQPKRAQQFFNYLEDSERGFNGDLFPITSAEYKQIKKEDLQVLRRLLQGEDIGKGQLSLFELYDFSIIPIEFISNVYELFIGQNNQKEEGAYYTPLFLVDYILSQTVEKHLSSANSYSCKVLDPACGSGIFLVETLRKIIEKYIELENPEIKSDRFKTAIKNLAQDNIYGVDKDESAVQVAVFSIYLTLLDYLEPPGIETFKFPHLLNSNFFVGDFFDETASFNEALKKTELKFILGNPPWKGNGMDALGNAYLKGRKKRERIEKKKFEIAINNNEIAEGFILRVSDFCAIDTHISFIVRSSSLYNLGYSSDELSQFRQYWLEEFFIDKVFELAPVRHEVFEKSNRPAIAPAAVLFYRYAHGKPTSDNIVEHIALKPSRFFSLFKIFTINRPDYKRVEQKKLKEFDWLWKVLVYGSYLDFNFIKRLKESYPTIKHVISDETKFVEGTGIQFSSNPAYSSKHLIGKDFLDSYGLTSFFIVPEKIFSFNKTKVHRLRDEQLFKAPMLLFREGIDMDTLTVKCAISNQDFLFKDSISSIKTLDNTKSDLYNIAALFSSSLFAYYAVNTFVSIGIERERVKNYNKYSLPYIDLDAHEEVATIEWANEKIYSELKKALADNIKIEELKQAIHNQVITINTKIFQQLQLNDVELALINYVKEVNQYFIVSHGKQNGSFSQLKLKDNTLISFADLFINRFKSKLDSKEKKFVVEIWHTQQIVGMFFKMIPASEYTRDIIWQDKQNKDSEIISALVKLSSEKITDRLFVQKDIRGFDKDMFYIFKPNEKRLWHKAIGYLDVNEFADAILKAGRDRQ